MSFSMGCFFLMTGLMSCAVARGCENVCCLTLFQIPFYFAMLFASLFIPNCGCQLPPYVALKISTVSHVLMP